MFLGTTKVDKEAAFLLLSEAFNADQQHLDHAALFATSLLAEARVELQVQPSSVSRSFFFAYFRHWHELLLRFACATQNCL